MLLSTSMRKPDDAMMPNSKMEIPPSTAVGIVSMTAISFPKSASFGSRPVASPIDSTVVA